MATTVFSMPRVQPNVLALGGNVTSLTDLANVIVAYMNRTDLGPAIQSFIGIAEGRIALDLRTWQMVKALNVVAPGADGYITVPADWLEWDRVSANGRLLEYMTRDQFWEASADGGQSSNYTMTGDRLIVAAPTSSAQDWNVKATYYARIPALNDTDPPPWLLTQYPQVYIYGSLVSACEFVKDEARANGWAGMYAAVVTALNSQSYKATVSGSTLRQRGPRG